MLHNVFRALTRFYARRVAGCDCHYRHPDCFAFACGPGGARGVAAIAMLEQSQANGAGACRITMTCCGRSRRPCWETATWAAAPRTRRPTSRKGTFRRHGSWQTRRALCCCCPIWSNSRCIPSTIQLPIQHCQSLRRPVGEQCNDQLNKPAGVWDPVGGIHVSQRFKSAHASWPMVRTIPRTATNTISPPPVTISSRPAKSRTDRRAVCGVL